MDASHSKVQKVQSANRGKATSRKASSIPRPSSSSKCDGAGKADANKIRLGDSNESQTRGKATSRKASSIPRPSSSSKCDGAGKADANKLRSGDSNESQTRGKATSQKASSIPRPSSSSKCDGAGKADAIKIRPDDSNESQTRSKATSRKASSIPRPSSSSKCDGAGKADANKIRPGDSNESQTRNQGCGDAGTDNLLNVPWKPTSNWFEPSRNFAANSQYADMWNPSSHVQAEKAQSSEQFGNTQAAMINNPLFHQPIASKPALFDQARILNSLASGTDASLAAAGRGQPQYQGWGNAGTDNLLNVPWKPTSNWFEPSRNFATNSQYADMWNPSSKVEAEKARSSKKFRNTQAAMINNPLFHQPIASKHALFDQARISNSLASGTDASLAAAGRGQPQSEEAQSSKKFRNTSAAMINNPLFHQSVAAKQALFDQARIPNSLASGTDASLAAAGRGQPQYQGWGDAGTDNLLNVPWKPTSNCFEPSRNFAANSQYADMWNPSSHVQAEKAPSSEQFGNTQASMINNPLFHQPIASKQAASSTPRPSSSSKCDGAGKADVNKTRPGDSNESQTRGSLFKGNQHDGSDVRGSTSAPTSTVQNIQSANRVIACEIYNENRHTDKEDISEKKLKSYCDELGELLIKEAKDNCGVDQLLPNCEIRIAQVQISQSTLWTDEIGHKTSRKEIAEIIKQPPKSDITAKQLFDKAKKFATKLASHRQSFTDEDRNHYVETHGNFVAVIGQAGIGKTTLSKFLLDRVTSDERWFGADFVFYLQFREIDWEEKTNFLRFLTKQVTVFWMNDERVRNAVLDRLAQSSSVCIIMDGFDEANLQYDNKSSTVVDLHSEATAKDFIRNIFSGHIFRNAKKLLTSRPRQLYGLPEHLRPRFIVTILGLDEDGQKQICADLCDSHKADVLKYFENHPDISSYCFVPVNCILVMRCIEQLSKNEKSNYPTTLTGVLIGVLGLFSESPQVEKHFEFTLKLLEAFAKLAQSAFSDNNYSFNEADLKIAGLDEKQLTTFFITVPGKNEFTTLFGGRSPKHTYFSHFLWQELFVAIDLIIVEDFNDSIKLTYKDLTSSRFENVSKFLFGLCNTTIYRYLIDKFPQIRPNLTEQAELLQSMTLENLPDLSVLKKESFQEFLRICSWVNEMHDGKFTNEFAEKINDEFFVEGGEMLPSDVVAFHYVLRNRSLPLSISIDGIEFAGDSCTRFLKELPKTIESSLITMKKLDISYNRIGDDEALSLSTCISRIEELHVRGCGFTAEGFKALASKIKELPKPMRMLDISENDVGDDAVHSLSTCISRIEELHVAGCRFTVEGFKALASIKELSKLMEKLVVRSLHLSRDEVEEIFSDVGDKLKSLEVW